MKPFSIAIAQINATVGDIAGNAEKIRAVHASASKEGADLVITPELSLIGYPPEDLVLMPALRKAAMQAVSELIDATKSGAALIVGTPWEETGDVFNAAVLMDGGKIIHVQPKTSLPNYGIFDEKRIFVPGAGSMVECRGVKLGILICEDMWSGAPAIHLKDQGAEQLVVINASPFDRGKHGLRRKAAETICKSTGLPLAYVNMIGGQDDIVFDGGSFALSADSVCIAQLPWFEEHLGLVNKPSPYKAQEELWHVWEAMKLGLADYVRKNGFSTVVLGLSGGVDSALTAAVAADALGADNVKGILLPSPYTSEESTIDALETGKLLGIETITVSITAEMATVEEILSPVFKNAEWMKDISVGGNVQSRLRGLTLMALSNKFGWMLLSTGNKSEIAVGYTTLYGDSCGSYNVLKDLYKTQVYELSRWRNKQSRVVPERSITKPPSAELAPGQKDEDQLPPYDLLDQILHLHLEGRGSAEEIINQGFKKDVVEKVVKMVRSAEYKRRQSCPGVKLSSMMFGKDRRFPLTNKF